MNQTRGTGSLTPGLDRFFAVPEHREAFQKQCEMQSQVGEIMGPPEERISSPMLATFKKLPDSNSFEITPSLITEWHFGIVPGVVIKRFMSVASGRGQSSRLMNEPVFTFSSIIVPGMRVHIEQEESDDVLKTSEGVEVARSFWGKIQNSSYSEPPEQIQEQAIRTVKETPPDLLQTGIFRLASGGSIRNAKTKAYLSDDPNVFYGVFFVPRDFRMGELKQAVIDPCLVEEMVAQIGSMAFMEEFATSKKEVPLFKKSYVFAGRTGNLQRGETLSVVGKIVRDDEGVPNGFSYTAVNPWKEIVLLGEIECSMIPRKLLDRLIKKAKSSVGVSFVE